MTQSSTSQTSLSKRSLPTPKQALAGIPVAIENAERHLRSADLLGANGDYGPAVAHLVLALEETDKSRVLGMLWLDESDLTEAEARKRLFDHAARNAAAFAKSWTIGVVWTAMSEFIEDQAPGTTPRTDAQRWARALAQHPEALPEDWPEVAGGLRESGLYVDLKPDGTWHTPAAVTKADYERFRPAAVHMIGYVKAAFERHKAERARSAGQV